MANAGVLLTRVEYLKHTAHKDFAIVDAAMNDLIRPALYQAWMAVEPVTARQGDARRYDLVGPICETGDFLAKDRELVLAEGDLLAIRSAGAYGFTMSSNYNTRGRAAEVMVDGDQAHLVRRRETLEELFAGESRCRPEGSSMQLRFTKMHGLGNDFMVLDLISQHAHIQPSTSVCGVTARPASASISC